MTEMASSLNKLFDAFNIKAKCVDAKKHRHFAFYDVKLDDGTRISRLTRYATELQIKMCAKTPIIVTPIPEKGIVRLSTTHDVASIIYFDKLYEEHVGSRPTNDFLPFLLGETDEGEPLWVDMAKNPHLLVAGATGSGKSIFLHNLIANAAKRHDVKLCLIDTKRVEFNVYTDERAKPLVYYTANDYDNAISILDHLTTIMEGRYRYMAEHGMQSVEDNGGVFDKWVVVIDEAADLMLFNKRDKTFEHLVVRLAQKARAAGIYMVLATQRPSVDVLTGLIKSNFPARLSCKVSTKVDSRVVLDQHGAENLAGRGDAIIKQPAGEATRLQVAFVDQKQTINKYAVMYN
jgi:S-DNA-T family DNA segregation ATPase FtsK/SpoIIIE